MKYFYLLSFLIVCVYGQSTDVTTCTYTTGVELPMHTYIEGCTEAPCEVTVGEYAIVHMVFRAPHTIRSMTTKANAFLLLAAIDYDLAEHSVTCNYLTNTYCPLVANEIVQYELRMYIEPIFPSISVNIEFHIEDENKTPITCFRTRITVLRPTKGGIGGNSTMELNYEQNNE